jgi:hypothetical protein
MIFHDWLATEIIPDALAWYQYQYGGSAGQVIYDSIGSKHLECAVSGAPVLTENVIGNQPGWYFDGTSNPLAWTGSVTVKHVFILASNEDATFDGYQGLLTGVTSGDVLVGDSGQTTFFDLGIGNVYTNEGIDYAEANQQAPMSGSFRLMEVSNSDGILLDGIQVGQQRSLTARKWKGHFVEMILFDRILTRDEVRRVRLYFNIKFGEWQRGLPFYFPSADIVPTMGPSRFYDMPEDFAQITDDWEYEDGVKDFNEVADDAPLHWEYAYPAVPKAHLPIYNEFWNQARLVNTFLFKDPEDYVWTNVRIEDYNRNHEAHKRWRHDVAFRLVGYNSVGTYEAPIDTTAPSVPGLFIDTEYFTYISIGWTPSTDDTGVVGYEYRVDGGTPVDVGNVLAAVATGLTPTTTYDFEVRAYDAYENYSDWSPVEQGTTTTPTITMMTDSDVVITVDDVAITDLT